jgi:RHS repeat-associated protein
MGGFIYQNDILQFVSHEEGRARWALHRYVNGSSKYGWEYDYFIKDHLGNTRMVLTQEKDTAQYIATMEAAYRATENQLFYNIPQSSYARSAVSGYPSDPTTNPNDSLIRVNGNGPKTGPSILLKVMSGDKVDVATKSFYKSGGTVQSPNSILTDVLNSLAGGIVTATSASHGVVSDLTNTSTSPIYAALNSFLPTNDPNTTGKPKAYLNWILLDDQFKGVSTYPQSGAMVVGSADALNTLAYSGIPITKNGYLYIWVSNETPGWDVFFDNLSVKQYSGAITEETHYYPFGLTMAGISSKTFGGLENKKKYNGIEFDNDLDLNEYEADLRDLDPQTGRWWQVDPETEDQERWSPYTSNNDNPILYQDPRGNEGEACCGGVIQLGEDAIEIYRAVRSGENIADAAQNDPITWKTVVNGIVKAFDGPEDLIKVNPKDLPANKGSKPVELTLPPDTYVVTLPPDTKVPDRVQSKAKKGPKDLVAEAKAAQQKQAEAQARAAERAAQTARGNSRTGNSNKGTKGSHDSGGRNKQKHTKADTRRAADQKVKGPNNTY